MPPFAFVCPRCTSILSGSLNCSTCGQDYSQRNGIYRFLLAERLQALESFMSQYRLIRNLDGYRSRPAQYYRSLPYTNPLDAQAEIWRVRAQTFGHLLRRVRARAAGHADVESGPTSTSLAVLDLGAGNGWLSHRLAALGHRCVAVDCSDDPEDGLGAFVHYSTPFTCVQADFNQLPFTQRQFDIVIFNASLHYSPDIQATLRHAYNLLVPGGALVVMDSPTFWSATSGQRMLKEQAARWRAQSETGQLVRLGVGYLSADDLIVAGRRLHMEFRFTPSRGTVGWAVRRRLAGLKLRREPASFGLWYGRA